MPKRKWNRLHDEAAIADERDHRARSLREQREARATVEQAVAERDDEVPTAPPEAGPGAAPRPARRRRE